MEYVQKALTVAGTFLPVLIIAALVVLSLFFINRLLAKRWQDRVEMHFRFQLTMLLLYFLGVLVVIVCLPINDTLKGQLLGLIGIILSAAIALSSTTFIGNILAGVMLKVVNSIRPGDFVSIDNMMGRITEMGLLHVEMQTEDRDLITMPNLFTATQAVKVTRASGTIVSAEVSLGYDVSRKMVAQLLKESIAVAGLSDGFVQVRELGDFSIVYRAAGLLKDVSGLISTRSKLREAMLDALHDADIEIVSPNFMNTKALDKKVRFIPQPFIDEVVIESGSPEDVIFDKADSAATIEKIRKRIAEISTELGDHKSEKNVLTEFQVRNLEMESKRLNKSLEFAEEDLKKNNEED